MESEILTIQLIPNWGYDILITIIPSLVIGIAVGLVVGLILRKRHLQDVREIERYKDIKKIIIKFIEHVEKLKTHFANEVVLMLKYLKEGNERHFGQVFNITNDLVNQFNSLFLKSIDLLDRDLIYVLIDIYTLSKVLMDQIDIYSHKYLKSKSIRVTRIDIDFFKHTEVMRRQLWEILLKTLDKLLKYRANL